MHGHFWGKAIEWRGGFFFFFFFFVKKVLLTTDIYEEMSLSSLRQGFVGPL